jgi:hypothetical protein
VRQRDCRMVIETNGSASTGGLHLQPSVDTDRWDSSGPRFDVTTTPIHGDNGGYSILPVDNAVCGGKKKGL